MIQLVADQSFPASVEQYRSMNLDISRWAGERVSDRQLLVETKGLGAHGVLFVGLQPLIGSDLPVMARELGLYLAATVEVDPFEAVRSVSNVVGQLEREVAPGRVHAIYARELRQFEIG